MGTKRKSKKQLRRLGLETIEPRILYSADFTPGLLDPTPVGTPSEERALEVGGEFAQATALDVQQRRRDTEIVFVDVTTPDYDQLVQDIRARSGERETEVVVLDVRKDGIKQITDTLTKREDVSAVHIISHGADGSIQLGKSRLTFDSLLKNASRIKGWGDALTKDADILIYGCDVAASEQGKRLVDALSRLTGADVAASEDVTGALAQGGDWDLEYATGLIDARSAISLQAQLDWRGTLATYTVTSTANAGAGSLRQALTNANANAGTDNIVFNIGGAGPHVINLTSTLPTINEAVILDASSNPDFAGTPVIELRGGGTVANAFTVSAGGAGSTIRGFVLSGFSNYTIHLDGGNNLIAGNYIGTNAAGSAIAATPNVEGGIRIEGTSNNNTIGGTTALDRNVISGNGVGGNADDNEISVLGDNNVIIGNYIGVAADGTTVIGNPNDGVDISTGAQDNTVGGLGAGEGNLIAGHTSAGVRIQNNASGSTILGNTIWGNTRGVAISGGSTGHLIQQNSIYGNTNLGIDLGADDVTAVNDGAKPAGQPNLLMDFPVIQSASLSGATLTVSGYVGSAPNQALFGGARVEFFKSPDAAGVNGEGQTYLGFLTANASGNFSGSFVAAGLIVGEQVTATATDGLGNTSEFAVNFTATAAPNNAPVLANTVVTLNAVNEDSGAPSGAVGTLVTSMTAGVSDVDPGALAGIAITAADASNGTWWYSINNGGNWFALGTPAVTSARLLAADAGTRIYFQPNAQYHGTLANAITFRAWDRTSGSNGATADLTGSFTVLDQFDAVAYSGNNSTIYWTGNWQEVGESDGAAAGDVFVANVGQVVAGPYLEMDLSTAGAGLSRQVNLAGATSATLSFTYEQDTNSAGGQVALEVFDGTAWNTVQTYHIDTDFFAGLAGVYQSFDISAYAAANTQVRFRTVQAAAGDRFFADDVRIDYTGIGAGGNTAFSTATDTAALTVNSINDAPVASGSAILPSVLKDALNPPGTTVSALFAGNYSDALDGTAASALSGAAIIANAATGAQGAWQYSSDGVNWNNVPTGGLGDASALVLPSSYSLRFLPAAGYNGAPGSLTARLSDASAGAIAFSASSNIGAAIGGTGNWSSASIAAGITVTAGNFAAYEDFNYASGGAGLSGSGGSGWSGAWNGAGAQTLITNGGLIGPGGGLQTSANGVQLNIGSAFSSTNPTRDLSTSLGGTSGTLWASFLLTPDRTTASDYLGIMLGQAGQQLFVGYTGATFKMNNAGGGGTNINVGGLVSGQTAFVVLRLDLSASGTDTATLYLNPTTGLSAPDVAGSAAKTDLNVGAFNAITIAGGRGASANASIIDEIRIGDTYASVAPLNQAPAAADVSGSGTEDAASVAVTLSGTDADGTVQSFRLSSLPANGTLFVDAGLTTAAATGTDYAATGQQRTLYFVPAADWSGTSSFQFVARDDDGRLDASTNTASITVNAANDAPVLANTVVVLNAVNEDAGAPSGAMGTLVSGLVAGVSDVDSGALQGIAITAADTANGNWWYSTDNGVSWNAMGSPDATNSRLLAADAGTRVYFEPAANYSGSVGTAITFRAWDRTSGSNGGTANTGSNGGTTAFSAATDTASITINPTNDAPVLDNSGTMTFTAITEDDTANSGELVSSIIASAGGDRITDADGGAAEGIAIAALVSGNGVWEYSTDGGGSWNAVGAVSDNSALLLRAADRLRFVPDGQNADLAIVSFRAWDQSSGTAGTKVDVSANGGSTAFSTSVETASISVTSVNDAPALADTVVTLNAVNEDAGAPVGAVGTLVSALVGGISDVDSGAEQGIAITAADTANGSWWYSTDNGASWNAMGSPDATSSRLLAADAGTRVYFEPAANFSGSIGTAITFRAWDRTSGSNGGTANTGSNGGTTAFSAATDSAGITVNTVNDAPSITAIADQTIAEDAGTAALAFTIGDAETAPGSLTVTASSSNTTLIPNGNLVLGGAGANRTITVSPASDAFGGPVTITVSVSDGTNTTQETFDVTVTPVADTPAATNAATNEDTQTTSGLVISRSAADGAETTHFKITAIAGGTLYLNDGTTVVNSGDFITFAQGNAGLKFTPSPNSAANGSFDVQASTAGNDSGLGGAAATATIAVTAVNDEPSFVLGANQSVSEDAGAQTVNGFANALPGGGADEASQTFTYTVSNDNNALFAVQPTIDASGTLSYASAANAFGSATVTVFVTDSGGTANGGDNTSASQTFTITVNSVADAPTVVLPGAGLVYVEDQAGQPIDATASIADPEANWNGGTLQAQITTGAQAADRLTILNSGGVSVAVNGTDVLVGATIVGTTAADTVSGGSALTVTFNAGATGSDVQAVARAIGYYSSSQDPSTAARTVTFTATDAGALAGSATQSVGVTRANDAPTLTASALNPTFAQGAGAPVSLFSGAAASTIESGQTISQVTLNVSNLANGAAERLRIDGTLIGLTNGASATTANNGYGVSVSVAASTATVTIVTTGASAAQLQTLVNGLAYHNSSAAPAGGPRTVALTALQDSGGTASGGVDTSSLSIAATVTVTTSGAIPVAANDGYSLTEEGSLTASGVSGWWNTAWQYRRQIAIDNLGRGQLTDFPILVALDSSSIDYAQTQNQGQDLRFVDGDGTLLAHEIESWNEAGTSYVWVKVPVLDANSSSDTITMYYGNAAAADGQNADAVWNSAYVGVWHLSETGSGAADEFGDSSGTDNHGRGGAGTAADTPIQGSGRIGTGQEFDGSSDFIDVQNAASLQLTTAMTLEGWVRMDSFGVADVVNALLRKGENNPNNYQLSVGQQTPFFTLDDGENTGVVDPSTINAGQWYHLSATFDGTTRGLYVNGILVASDAYSGPVGTDLRDLYIGGRPGTDWTDGVIDEARVSNTARSADWIAAQYANVTSAGYLTFAAQESATGGGVLFNDSDADGEPLTAVLVAPPSDAAVFVLNADGSFTYTPNTNFAGTDTFTYRANDGSNNSNLATVTITVNPVNDEPSFTLAGNQTASEDAGAQTVAGFAISSAGGGVDESAQTFTYTVSNNNNSLFSVQPTIDAGGNLTYTLTANTFGSATVTVFVTDSGGTAGGGDDTSPSQTFTITVNAVADTPTVTNAATTEDTQTTSGLVISRNAVDGAEVTHFKITGIAGGTLYQNDGITVIGDGAFVTIAQGGAGLKFTPSLNSTANGSFQIQASTASNDSGLGGGIATATITVNPANDAPVVTAGGTAGYAENGAAVAIDATITVTDVDDTQMAGATVTISGGFSAGDVLGFVNTATITGSYNAGTGVLTLSGTDTVANYQAALRSVTYASSSDDPTALSVSRTVSWQVTDANADGTGAQISAPVNSAINVTAQADAPVVTAGAVTGYTENGAAVVIDATITVTDVDDTQIAGATVTISAGLSAGDVLGFVNTATITGSYNPGTGVLTLSGTDTLANYQAALRSVTYSSTSEDPTATSASRTIGWQIVDANSDSAGAQVSAVASSAVNLTAQADAPIITAGAITGYTENGAAVVIDATITVTDVDDTQIAGATVNISAGLSAGDVLGFVNTATITGSYNAGTGVLTLSGTDSLANYQAALRSVTYASASEDPTAGSASRTIGWQVVDANSDSAGTQISAVASSTVNLTAQADAPIVNAGAVTSYTENGAAVAIDNTITVSDADDSQIAGATVTISAGFSAGDVLGFVNTATITGSYNAGTGVLTLSGSDTLGNYQAALRSVTFASASDDPTATSASRAIDWQVTDANSDGAGAQSSAVVSSTVNLTAQADTPVATAGAVSGYTENAVGAVIDSTITVADVDDTQIAGATVTISAGFSAGDVLGFISTATITGSYNAGTGVLTLNGTDTLANYEAALRSVTYASTSENPTAGSASRTISWQVTDADSDAAGAATSVAVASAMNVTPIDDAPVLGANTLTINQGANVVLSSSILSASDVDNPAAALSFLVSNVTSGQFELISAPGVAVSSFTQAEVFAGQVRFVHDGNPMAPTYDVRVDDGTLVIGPFSASVTFNPTLLTVSTPPPPPPPEPPPFTIDPPPAAEPEPVTEAAPARGEPGDALIDAGFSPGRVLANFNDLTEISVRLAAAEARVPLKVTPPPDSNPNKYDPRPSVEPQVELLAVMPAELSFNPSMPTDWTVTSAFGEGPQEQIRTELEVLLDSVKFGGMALSVGVVWWASRISGLLGTLLASTPAWRHIDPLPVLGRDDDKEDQWYEPDDGEADANELAVSLVLDGGRRAAGGAGE